ncbi:ribosome maturation factor RimM [Candidatus Rariloculus sp.]|uniref:ribosome maturation factor RimM n=1 Tax=Candidatus Rariloculus sp. TaxID=3101265 RepID=UPI003D14AF53
MSATQDKLVKLGRIAGVHGINGWVKVHSYTEPRDNVIRFERWVLARDGEHREVNVEGGDGRGGKVLAKLSGIEDRDAALALVGADIAVARAELPPCGPGEYYWTDLEGLAVRDSDGKLLGIVDHLLASGVQDVLVLEGGEQRLIPFVADEIVREVDLERGVIVVDWDASYWEK